MRLTQANRAPMNAAFTTLLRDSYGKLTKGLDQSLLRKHLWSIFSKDMISHDSFLCNSYKTPFHRPFPTQRLNGPNFTDIDVWNFVGSNGGKIHMKNHGPCPAACRPKEHQDWLMC